jgi:hypothetical protein
VVVNNNNHYSFNGRGGVTATASVTERQAFSEHHIEATSEQSSHQQTASKDRSQFATVNHGKPTVAAMNKVGGTRYSPQGHVAAKVNTPARATTATKPTATRQAATAKTPATQQKQQVNRPQASHTAVAVKHTAPVTKAPQQQHTAAKEVPQSHTAPVTKAAAPKQQRAAPVTHTAAAPKQQHAAPVVHAAAPKQQVVKSKPPTKKEK